MAERKRSKEIHFYVTEEERKLIRRKMIESKTKNIHFTLPYHTTRKGTVDRLIRTAALGLSAGVPQNYIHQSSHKRQAQCLPCRH